MGDLTAETIRQSYDYYAFISYSRKDEKWAKWLQNRLETYRLPAAIRKNHVDLPQKIAPVFRDKTDLSGIVLEEALHRELEASKYLIVICSPNSAASDYVSKEITHFAALGRERSIIPFIIDGEPFCRDPEQECFPRALQTLESELLGISVPELGRTNAFLRLVSTLLNLKYDQVVMRDTRRRIRRNGMLAAAALILCTALAITVWYNAPHTKYYNAYIYRNEIPVGIHELSRTEQKVSHDYYRITTQRGKVIKLECINSAGLPETPAATTVTYEYPVLEFHYNDIGKLDTVDQLDEYGQLISTKDLSYSSATNEIAIDFRLSSDSLLVYALSADMTRLTIGGGRSDNSEITRLLNVYSDDGLLIRSTYQKGNLGTAACDSNGVYGKHYEYNELGQVIRVTNLDSDGSARNNRLGWATVEYAYDDRGNIVQSCYYDADGNPARNEDGAYREVASYDENNNMVLYRYLDENGSLYNTSKGFAEQRVEYDARGFMLSVGHFDALGLPTYGEYGFHAIRYEYDANHRCTANSYHNIDSMPMYVPADSCAMVRAERNDAGQITQILLYDAAGNLTCDTDSGAYITRCEYGENGYPKAYFYLDDNNRLTMTKYGYASIHFEQDSAGNPLRIEYRDENGDLVRCTENVAVIQRTYDTFGNWTGVRYFDENEAPCVYADGTMGAEYVYENGNLVCVQYVDEQGNPALCPDGYSERRMTYQDGDLISRSYYGTDGSPVLCPAGYHEIRMEYENGNCTRKAYYDTEGNLTPLKHKAAVLEYAFDAYGNNTEICYYDQNLEPVLNPDYYRITMEYDQRGNKISETVYTFDNKSLPYHKGVYEYDAHNNIVRMSYYEKNGDPIKGDLFFPSEVVQTFDAKGNLIREEHLNGSGLPLLHKTDWLPNVWEYGYDDFGNLVLRHYIHADASGNEEFLGANIYTYDERGNKIRHDHYDESYQLSSDVYDYASCVMLYTPTGEIREEIFYGEDGSLRRESDGYPAYCRYEYDDRGNLIAESQYNENGDPCGSSYDEYHRTEYRYDAMGNVTQTLYYDDAGILLEIE